MSSMLFGAASAGVTVPLVTFDGAAGTTFNFKELNDPVMGGKSTGNWSVQSGNGQSFGVMNGQVVNVPSLSAPGFIKSAGDGKYADASAALSGGLRLTVRSQTPGYQGFRLTFAAGTLSPDYSCAGGGSIPLSRGCFKRQFTVAGGKDFSEVYLPFNSFSDKWSPSTGKQTTTCAEDADVCPKAKDLSGIVRMEFWAEGAAGAAELEVLKVEAVSEESAVAVRSTAGGVVPLVSFDGAAGTTFSFKELNDPVMGGKSTGTWAVQKSGNGQSFGVMNGQVVNVPSLSAPGFIKSAGDGTYNDASAALSGGLNLTVRSTTPEYAGFRLTFAAGTLSPDYSCAGGGSIPLSRGCFKRQFTVPAGKEFSSVYLPFNTFSDKWSPSTGKQTTTCADDADVCPKAKDLSGIVRMEFWAEGAAGAADLEVLKVDAVY